MFKNYLATAWKAIWKNKQVSIINIIGLSVGMTAAVLMLLWVQNELSYDSYHPNADNIYRITNTLHISKDDEWVWENSSLNMTRAAAKEIPEVENAAMLYTTKYRPITFNFNNEIFAEPNSAYVSKGWFDIFSYQFVEGSPAAFFKNPYSVILTQSKARKYFAGAMATGRTMRIDSINYTVQGVVKDNPAASSFQYDVLLPQEALLSDSDARQNAEEWGNFNFMSFVQLHKGANPAATAKKLTNIVLTEGKDSSVTSSLEPLKQMHFETGLQFSVVLHADKKVVYIFSIFAVLLIVTACINYINLTTARASLRVKEISIRKIAGAKRKQLFMQFVAECVVISIIALCVTLVLIQVFLPWYNLLTEKNFELPPTSPLLWKVLGGTLLFATVINSIYPAMLLSSFNPLNIFRGINVLRVKDATLRKGLVVFQFSLSVMLIICSVVIFKQLHFIQTTNPGYNREQIVGVQLPIFPHTKMSGDERNSMVANMSNELRRNSNVVAVTLTNQPIAEITSTNSGSADWDGRPKTYKPTIAQVSADENYQKVFGVQLAQGRWFDEAHPADKHNFILNETAAKQLKIHTPYIGQRFSFHGDTGQIVGVVKDFHYKSMHDKIGPLVMYNGHRSSYIFIKAAPGKAAAVVEAARALWMQWMPGDVFDYTFMDDTFNNLYKADLKVSSLILLFAVIVVIISCMGLFALAAFTAEQRTKEIGIRKVLGATVSSIVTLLSKDFIRLVALAVVIASPVAWWLMSRWLQDFAYRVSISWWVFFAAGFVALFIALATISMQAIRAALANPTKSLRSE